MNRVDNKTFIRKQLETDLPSESGHTRIRKSNNPSQNSRKDQTKFKMDQSNSDTRISHQRAKATKSHAYTLDKQSNGHHGVLKGRFILANVIGSGGMGVVYKAKDLLKVEAKDRDPYVAIKVLSEEFKSHPEAFISLQRESRKSQRIAHPNIVNVFDFDRDGDVVFMTMEFMDGRPLDRIIRQYTSTGLPTEDAWRIIKSICSALIHAHGMNIIHSDFKPGNIFVTKSGITKVFDFGIARAVAKVKGYDGKEEDRTVFDAGNLGALTPAYASLEMLEGEKPDARDDIYALGCIAYECFTGKHPFNRVPADEALRQGLSPKRISNISKRQWNAIKKSLAFKREDRLSSVQDFLTQVTKQTKKNIAIPFLVVLICVLLAVGYYEIKKNNSQGLSESEIRSKVQFELQLNFHKNTIENLIVSPEFTISWEEQLWRQYSGLNKMLVNIDKLFSKEDSRNIFLWKANITTEIYTLYIKAIQKERHKNKFKVALMLIENAKRYTNNFQELEYESKLVYEGINNFKSNNILKERSTSNKSFRKNKVRRSVKKRVEMFNIALNNVNQQLRCQSKLNMRNIDVAIKKLKSYNNRRYNRLKPKIISRLASCITELGKAFPKKAYEYKKYAMRIFNKNKIIVAIQISPRDPCNVSIAGLGARGKRTVCRDKFKGSSNSSPDLIVVYGNNNINTFAISKYEVSINELNLFCKESSLCIPISNRKPTLPVTNISFKVVKAYIKWLSKKTGKRYRIPSKNEWLYAATANKKTLDPNRNCYLRTRGIEKGEKLFASNVGIPNSWGMVNYIGNAREWVFAKGRELQAVGGSYNSPMHDCNFSTNKKSNGIADKYTGFRLVREVKN